MDLAFPALHFPLLSAVVEFDVAGSGDFKPAEFMQRDNFCPKALSGSVGVKRYCGVHVCIQICVVGCRIALGRCVHGSEALFGVKGAQVSGFPKSAIAQWLHADLRACRINSPMKLSKAQESSGWVF